MKKLTFLLLFNLLVYSVSAQKSDYEKSFNWVVKTFEENDAGFSYIIERKGADYYNFHTNKCRKQLSNIHTDEEFISLVKDWLHFFRKGHIGFYLNDNTLSENEIRTLYANEDKIDFTEDEFRKYLQKNKNKINPIEGIWTNKDYTIGIVKEKNTDKFNGFVIKADSVYWLPKQKKAEFELQKDGSFNVVYSMRDHSKEKTKATWCGKSFNAIKINGDVWLKTYPAKDKEFNDDLFFRFIKSSKPFISKISDKTIYLRIPSFLYSAKADIDSLLKANDKMIKSTENLIIDIRNGTGGSDYSYFGLMPYIYTQPIRKIGMKCRSSELNARAFEGYAKEIADTQTINYLHSFANEIRNAKGKYYDDGQVVALDSSYSPSVYPKKVAVICNKNNGSTDESFLLDVKQSHKVKVYGCPTGGMIDATNVNEVTSPNGKFTLYYTLAISNRVPNYLIDDIGIQPDIYIDETISDIDWVDFVQKHIEQK